VFFEDTERVASPYGGLAVFMEFLNKIGYTEALRRHMPVRLTSRNAIEPEETFTAFLVSVGARRFAHAGLLRFDRALHSLLGLERFPTDDTIRNLFKRFTQGKVTKFYEGLTQWQIERLPEHDGGYSLDLDSFDDKFLTFLEERELPPHGSLLLRARWRTGRL